MIGSHILSKIVPPFRSFPSQTGNRVPIQIQTLSLTYVVLLSFINNKPPPNPSPQHKKKLARDLQEDLHQVKMQQVVVHDHDDKADKEVYERLDHQNQEEFKICKLCGKRFHSAKALGGHLRVHYEEVKKSRNINSNSNNKIPCYVCKKIYPSLKSLYGHMSSHRERDWRGIRPPPPPPPPPPPNSDRVQDKSCSDDNDLKSDTDVAKFLVRLANGTDRRGRKRSSLIANNQTVSDYEETSSSTTSLAYKVNHPLFKKLKFFDGRPNKTMEAISTTSTGKADHTSAWKTMKPTILKIGTTRPMRDVDNLALVLDQNHHHNKLQIQRKPQKFVSMNMDDHESGFSTKLGPKGKLLYHGINNGSYRSSTQVDRADEEEAPGGHYIKQFVCNFCHKKFSSGQALGGHKRFHSYKKGPVEAPEAREVVALPLMAALPEEASDDGAGKVSDFDLNELPFESSEVEGMSG